MTSKRKAQIHTLLKGIETGDEDAVSVVNPEKYIQHNPETHEGGEGLAALFKRLSKTSPRVNIVRVFSDHDYVFAHTEYDFGSQRIDFEVFRFEGGKLSSIGIISNHVEGRTLQVIVWLMALLKCQILQKRNQIEQ